VTPVDVESAARAYLGPRVGVPVSTHVPNPRPPSFVQVTRAGGQARNLVQSDVRLLVECWDVTETGAFDLARITYGQLWRVPPGYMADVLVMGMELSEPVNYPDPSTPAAHRYQFIATATTSLADDPAE
jgi:hypothetical protein